jgi:hypothetical protein
LHGDFQHAVLALDWLHELSAAVFDIAFQSVCLEQSSLQNGSLDFNYPSTAERLLSLQTGYSNPLIYLREVALFQ